MAATRRKPTTHRDPVDQHAAHELVLYIENTSELSPDGPRGQGRSVLLNALRKWRKGTYDPALAVRLFEHLTEAGAKQYAKEHGGSFNPATRHEAARQLEESFRHAAEQGEYDHVDVRIGQHQASEASTRTAPRTTDRRAYDFFRKHAGDIVGLDAAWALAKAEQEAASRGWYVEWEDDPDGWDSLGDIDPETVTEVLSAVLRDADGKVLESLGSIVDPDRSYRRVVEAELALEALPPTGSRETREGARGLVREDRKYSMTYGTLPPFEKFEHDVHTRIDPDYGDKPYWPAGTLYPMELVSAHEIELAETFGLEEFEAERQLTGRNSRVRGFRDNEHALYEFLEFLVDRYDNGDEEAGELASSIMYTLGYEWV